MMSLSRKNRESRKRLQGKVLLLGDVIKSAYPFGLVTREHNPQEYFVALVLNKLYSFQVSLENIVLCNDVFLSTYLYRYIYELHIKARYLFSEDPNPDAPNKLNDFFEERILKFPVYLDKTKGDVVSLKLKEQYFGHYRKVSEFIHPNYASLKLHHNRSDEQQFEFLAANIRLTLWHISEILRLFSDLKFLNLDQKIDENKLNLLQNSEV